MSHFNVAVITKGIPTEEKIEKLLAPYQENDGENVPQEYLEFVSESEQYKDEYENGTKTRIKLKDGTLCEPWTIDLYEEVTRDVFNTIPAQDRTMRDSRYYARKDIAAIGAEKVEIPNKELYPTYENYLEESIGLRYDEKVQDYGYWRNPNAKWDWWVIGGRWGGSLTVKADCKDCETVEEIQNAVININGEKYKKVDIARIKDLEFPQKEKLYKEALRFWEMKVEGKEPKTAKEKEDLKFCFYNNNYFINRYGDKETYAECESTFHTYAVVTKDGKWHAEGEMGWFGMDTTEKETKVGYIKNYKNIVIDSAEDDDYITIVDCHI